MSQGFNIAELLRDIFYSPETWKMDIKIFLIFVIFSIPLILFRIILNMIARFIKK